MSYDVRRAYLVSRHLFREPGMLERVEELIAEARKLAREPHMGMMRALKFLAARGDVAAQGFLKALAAAQLAGPERDRQLRRARSKLRIVR